MISYPNALDEDGRLINIFSVKKDNKSNLYRCLGCGQEMIPVLGDYRSKHFRHLVEGECNPETYLHEYSKRYLAAHFNSATEFPVTYYLTNACSKISECNIFKSEERAECKGINCCKTIDLKKEYDFAQIEGSYGGFRADILLLNKRNPSIPPLFLEIKVSSECSEDKIQSAIRIIEIEVQNEDDIKRPLVEFNEHLPKEIKSKRKHPPFITFHNFDRTVSDLFEIERFFICENAESGFDDEKVGCTSFFSQHHPGAVFEIGALGEHRDGIIAQVISQGFETKHCSFCRFYGECMVEIPGLVFNPKTRKKEPGIRKLTLHTLKEEDEDIDKYKRAKNCSRWRIDPSRLKRFQEKHQDKVFGDTVLMWHKRIL